jgi:hypothetical protein
MISPNQRLRRRQAAEYIGVKPETLNKWGVKGIGPKFLKLSSRCCIYDVRDLDAFLASLPSGGKAAVAEAD